MYLIVLYLIAMYLIALYLYLFYSVHLPSINYDWCHNPGWDQLWKCYLVVSLTSLLRPAPEYSTSIPSLSFHKTVDWEISNNFYLRLFRFRNSDDNLDKCFWITNYSFWISVFLDNNFFFTMIIYSSFLSLSGHGGLVRKGAWQ